MAFFRKKKEIPLGLWMKCPGCKKMAFTKKIEENLGVCPDCGFHTKVGAATRIAQLIDDGTFEPIGEDLRPIDALAFVDADPYEQKLKKASAKSGSTEAVRAGRGLLGGRAVTIAALDFNFMGGSMGVVVGERVALGAEDSLARRAPFLIVSSSGGARMQEGALSLMQMAKTSAAISRLKRAAVPFVSVLADPCTGGVSASFAAQGDVTIAEPGALVGFAGPRVIQTTIRTTLPEGFQTAEFLMEHGFVDRIVPRAKLKDEIGKILDYLAPRPAAPAAGPAVV
jgi:acetyl-CoA carboxylase carboxyl transferase subunit beta